MHIVILSDTLPPESPGGAGRMAWQVGQGIIAAGHQVTFVTSTSGSSRVETRQGITVHLLHSRYAERWIAWFGLMNPQTIVPLNILLRELRPDVVNAHNVHRHLGYHSLVIGRYAGAATVFTAHDAMPVAYGKLAHYIDPARPDACDQRDYRIPFGYNLRQMRLRWNPARNLSIRHTMRYYTDVRVTVSHELKAALEANRLATFDVVHNGLDLNAFNGAEVEVDVLRQRLQLAGRKVILFGGRLSRAKGAEQIMAALRIVRQRVPNVALLVLAQPGRATEAMVEQYPDLADQIVLGGWLDGAQLASAYRLGHVVATPSVYCDPFIMINLEGMAAGIPAVTTCFGGAHEVVVDGETGYVVNPYDVDLLAGRLTHLLLDDDLRRRMGQAGRRRAEAMFTLEHQTRGMLAAYERALARQRAKRGG